MRIKSTGLAVFCIAAVTTRAAYALIMLFCPADLELAGEGCVAGYISDGARTAYYRGDTELLNTQLKATVEKHGPSAAYIVRLYDSTHTVDAPETGIASQRNKQVSVDWSISEQREPLSLRTEFRFLHLQKKGDHVPIPLRLKPETRIVVNVWQSESVDIDRLNLLGLFTIERVTKSAE